MSLQELDDMKKRLKEMDDEAAALIEMQAKVEKEMGSAQGLFRSILFWGSSSRVFVYMCLFRICECVYAQEGVHTRLVC